jgi:polysaccharide biosynthesis transport protein
MMLQSNKLMLAEELVPQSISGASSFELYATILGFLRRQFSLIGLVAALTVALACLYIVVTPSKYSGRAIMLIDTHKSQVFEPQQSPLGDLPVDSATVDTQIEVLKSENIALSVIASQHLDAEAEFTSPGAGLIGSVLGFITRLLPSGAPSGSQASAEYRRMRSALTTFENNLSVKRTGLTYVIEIDFQSLNPDRAAQIANAVANAYVVETLNAKYASTRRAADWLQDRLKELREQSSAAERAVVDFRTKNNIVDTGGKLLNEEEITQLDNALVDSRSHTAEAKARLDRVQEILSRDPDPASTAAATVTDSLHDDVITKLRQQYLEYGTKEADWSARYGSEHQAVVNVRNQMRELRRAIEEELQRIAETYKSEYEIAKARESSVQKSLDELVGDSQTMNAARVTLHDLESSAATYRSLYDSFLQHYTESVQQQSFPVTDARLITEAARPLQKSSPKALLALSLASLGGLILGAAAGMLREISDRAFRTTAQVEERLRTECIGVLPLGKWRSDRRSPIWDQEDASAQTRTISRHANFPWGVMNSPLSRFAETIRSVKAAASIGSPGKKNQVIAVTSALPNEGKSTVAMALAQTIALGGGRTILIDCDLRNPALSARLAPSAQYGVVDGIFGRVPLEDVLWIEPASNLAFLPAAAPNQLSVSSDILSCEETRKFFETLRDNFDSIIIDLSPLEPVVDARVVTHLIDSFILVVEWGRTDIGIVEHALGSARGIYDNLLGVVLNKVNMKTLSRYENYREDIHHNKKYAQYGLAD